MTDKNETARPPAPSGVDDLQQRLDESRAAEASTTPAPPAKEEREISLWTLLLGVAAVALLAVAGVRFGPRIISAFDRPQAQSTTAVTAAQTAPAVPAPAPSPAAGPRAEVGDGFDDTVVGAGTDPEALVPASRPLGVTVRSGFAVNEFGEDVRGAVVTALTRDGAARAAGLRVGDTIVSVADIRVRVPADLGAALLETRTLRSVGVRVLRGTSSLELTVKRP